MKGRRGQGLVEYVLLVGAMALLLVGAVQAMRSTLGKTYGKVTSRLESVSHQIAGRADAPAGPAAPTATGRSIALASGKVAHEHAGPHTFERKIVLDEQTGSFVSAEVCTICGEAK